MEDLALDLDPTILDVPIQIFEIEESCSGQKIAQQSNDNVQTTVTSKHIIAICLLGVPLLICIYVLIQLNMTPHDTQQTHSLSIDELEGHPG